MGTRKSTFAPSIFHLFHLCSTMLPHSSVNVVILRASYQARGLLLVEGERLLALPDFVVLWWKKELHLCSSCALIDLSLCSEHSIVSTMIHHRADLPDLDLCRKLWPDHSWYRGGSSLQRTSCFLIVAAACEPSVLGCAIIEVDYRLPKYSLFCHLVQRMHPVTELFSSFVVSATCLDLKQNSFTVWAIGSCSTSAW